MTTAKINTSFDAPHAAMNATGQEVRANHQAGNGSTFTALPEGHYMTTVRVQVRFATGAEATEFLASFPKALRLRGGPVTGQRTDGTYGEVYGYAELRVALSPTDGNAKNETGVGRYRRFVKLLTERGVVVEYDTNPGHWNHYRDEAEFEAALAAYGA